MTPAGNKLLLDAVTPAVRTTLVRARARAMRGAFNEAVGDLDRAAGRHASVPADVAALGMMRAELFHLHRDDAAALKVLTDEVLSIVDRLTDAARFVVEGNLTTVRMAAPSDHSVADFYHLTDLRRMAGVEWVDYADLVEAFDAVDAGRPAAALETLWAVLVRSYRQGYWQATKQAEARLAKLLLVVGELERAAYHVVVGEADSLVEPLADAILARKDAALIRAVSRRLLASANLNRHFAIAVDLLARLHDALPDDELPAVARWLLLRCGEVDQSDLGKRIVPAAWKALTTIGGRLPGELAAEGIRAALAQPLWSAVPPPGRVIVDRQELIEAVTHLCYRVPAGDLGRLADAVLPLAQERMQDVDYPDVVNLLAHIAERAGEPVRRTIGDALYPNGVKVNRVLAQLDRHFGKEALTDEQLTAFAARVAGELRLQVQRVEPGGQPVHLPETLATIGRDDGAGGPVVTIGQGLGVSALGSHLHRLAPGVVAELIRAMLAAAQDPDNVPTNQELLLSQLIGFAGRADGQLRDDVFSAAESMYTAAVGGGRPSAGRAGSAFGGDPADVRAMALICCAAYSAGDGDRVGRVGEAIEAAAVDPNPKIRRGAFGAARRLPDLPADAFLPLLMGLRDPDPGAAVAAFSAFAERPEWRLTRPNWRLFLLAARTAVDSPHVNLRRHAALAVTRRAGSVPPGSRRELGELVVRFREDVSAEVRAAVRSDELNGS